MAEYMKDTMSKRQRAEESAANALTKGSRGARNTIQLRHGDWIKNAQKSRDRNRFATPQFLLLFVFLLLYVGSIFLFENMDAIPGTTIYAARIIISSLFAVSLGSILSIWWSSTTKFDEKIKEAERVDKEYRELLISFSDSLFDIINALNTIAANPPKPFLVATEFMLSEYVHLLQSQLQRYGDHIAGLGFDATEFLDEKIEIFAGIRERASLSVKDMPNDMESLFIGSLNLDIEALTDKNAQRRKKQREKLDELKNPEIYDLKVDRSY